MKSNRNRKAQIEIFGLAVIVILITIGFFIFASIRAQQPKSDVKKDFTTDKIANDFVLSIIDTNAAYPCDDYTIEDLIIDCVRDKRITCGLDTSCTALNRSVNLMLNRTFEKYPYKLRLYSENLKHDGINEMFNISYNGCTPSSPQGQRGSSVTRLYPGSGTVYIHMNICY